MTRRWLARVGRSVVAVLAVGVLVASLAWHAPVASAEDRIVEVLEEQDRQLDALETQLDVAGEVGAAVGVMALPGETASGWANRWYSALHTGAVVLKDNPRQTGSTAGYVWCDVYMAPVLTLYGEFVATKPYVVAERVADAIAATDSAPSGGKDALIALLVEDWERDTGRDALDSGCLAGTGTVPANNGGALQQDIVGYSAALTTYSASSSSTAWQRLEELRGFSADAAVRSAIGELRGVWGAWSDSSRGAGWVWCGGNGPVLVRTSSNGSSTAAVEYQAIADWYSAAGWPGDVAELRRALIRQHRTLTNRGEGSVACVSPLSAAPGFGGVDSMEGVQVGRAKAAADEAKSAAGGAKSAAEAAKTAAERAKTAAEQGAAAAQAAKTAAEQAKSAATSAKDAVTAARTAIESAIDDQSTITQAAKTAAEQAKSAADAAKTAIGSARSAIESAIAGVKSDISTARNEIAAAKQQAEAAKLEAGGAKTAAEQGAVWGGMTYGRIGDVSQAVAGVADQVAALASAVPPASSWSDAKVDQALGALSALQLGRGVGTGRCAETTRSKVPWWSLTAPTAADPCDITEGSLKRLAEAQEVADERIAQKDRDAQKAQIDRVIDKLKDVQDETKNGLKTVGDKVTELGDKFGELIDELKGLRQDVQDQGPNAPAPGDGGQPGTLPGASSGFGGGTRGKLQQWQDVAFCTLPSPSASCSAPFTIQLGGGLPAFTPIPAGCAPWEAKLRAILGAVLLIGAVFLALRWIVAALGVSSPEGD